jgi:phosphohistidine phosphatase
VPEQRRLLLLRHAKSSWDDPTLIDHDRPLAPRGRRAAERMGEYLRDEQPPVSLVLCSSARRTRETLELVSPEGEVRIEPRIYGASADELLACLQRLGDSAETVLLIGHNPAIEDLAVALSAGEGGLSERKYPTGAVAALRFSGPWGALEPGRAELVAFVTPRELA